MARDRAARLEACHRRLAEDWRAERRANRAHEAYRARGVMRDVRHGPGGHVDPKVTLSIYAQVMFRGEGERGRLEALIHGSEPSH